MVEEALNGRGGFSRVGTNVSMGVTGSLLFLALPKAVPQQVIAVGGVGGRPLARSKFDQKN